MKTCVSLCALIAGALLGASAPAQSAPRAAAVPQSSSFDTPTILSVRGRNVTVQVPDGYDQVNIQRRTGRRAQPWREMATAAPTATAGQVTVRLRTPFPKRFLRVIGHRIPAPLGVGTGLSNFLADPSGGASVSLLSKTGPSLSLNAGAAAPAATADTPLALNAGGAAAPARNVEEGDIWKVRGDRAYVYNAYRGLQVIDVHNAASPALLGTLYQPVEGEELYVLDDTHVALLVGGVSNFSWNGAPVVTQQGAVLVCDVSTGTPSVLARLPVDGWMLGSRLVGTALYVASEVPSPSASPANTGDDVKVSGFDFSDPAHPVARNAAVIHGTAGSSGWYPGAVQASDHFFLVAQDRYGWAADTGWDYRSAVSLVDISAPDGTVTLRGRVPVDGQVPDKFKLREQGGVLSVLSDFSRSVAGTWARHTHLENFSLTDPDHPKSLGELDLGLNESVRATRFDGDRVYVVTFLQVDPLWVVDNSNPAAPSLVGHVQVPGYSTFIQPLGDRLVTIGLVNGRVTVSLFDVADPAHPQVLSQLPVSALWSYSEANWNEKAFTVLPDDGLIMLPVNESWVVYYDVAGAATPASGIQLVDLQRDSLALRGRIVQPFAPSRSTVHGGAVLAFGNASLLTADIADRDHPQVLAELPLARRADYVWHRGQYLVQLGGSIPGGDNTVVVSSAETPDEAIHAAALSADPVLAADLRDDYLYVVQQPNPAYYTPAIALDGAAANPGPTGAAAAPAAPHLTLTIFSTASLPALVKVGETFVTAAPLVNQYGARIVWPTPGTLVVSSSSLSYFYPGPIYFANAAAPIDSGGTVGPLAGVAASSGTASGLQPVKAVRQDAVAVDGASLSLFRFYPYARGLNLLAFDVTEPKEPAFLALTTVLPKLPASFSEVFAAGGRIFVTHQHSWWFYGPILASGDVAPAVEPGVAGTAADADLASLRGRYYLDVVDYADPAQPVVRPPVSAPGTLQGVARGGTVLYTVGPDYAATGVPVSPSFDLHASAYDGTKVELLATFPLSLYGSSVLPLENRVFTFVERPDDDPATSFTRFAQLVELAADGSAFTLLGETPWTAWTPRAFGTVLLGNDYTVYGSGISALDFADPANLQSLGTISTDWISLNLDHGDGSREDGFWLPAGPYGVIHFDLPAVQK